MRELIKKYASFSGAVTRMEFFSRSIILYIIFFIAGRYWPQAVSIPVMVISMACLWGLCIRRLRDIGWSIWIALLYVVPFIYVIVFIVLCVKDGGNK
jgi:uncharacterized membrane protein YhaH (DUF805 family)